MWLLKLLAVMDSKCQCRWKVYLLNMKRRGCKRRFCLKAQISDSASFFTMMAGSMCNAPVFPVLRLKRLRFDGSIGDTLLVQSFGTLVLLSHLDISIFRIISLFRNTSIFGRISFLEFL